MTNKLMLKVISANLCVNFSVASAVKFLTAKSAKPQRVTQSEIFGSDFINIHKFLQNK